ncbi:unnamed protein product [Rotaria magnacalcarata]|uniref:SWIM-type domain-containing protein n=2 Tax=Rotaria magnacalcarata TaxID=392030 RepID=A0A816HEM8_9BILA|nr:unnamed protein product [Rotaria magnacalcarata]
MNDIFSFFDELRSSPRLDFDDSSLTNEDYEAWTGWSEEQFNDMFKEISVYLRSSSNRTSLNALAIFWIKIKTNLSFRQIGSLFNISGNSDTRRLRAADAFDSVRELFIKYFVSKHLGIGHITIDDAKIHNTAYSKEFFGNESTLIWDGTYFFIGKSSSHSVNRSAYGGQKKRHYVKFMSIVHPDDYVSDVIGPFQGTLNDASIAEEILATNNALATWLGSNGHIIVDRGFRDVIETFQDLGYETHMPSFLKKGEKQHSTIDMNNSRMCTKIRWSVEAFHGRLKKWRIFQDKIHNLLIPKLKIKLARTYVEEHLDQEGDYTVELDANTDNILRCPIQSRHSNAVKYKSWIQYSLSGDPIIAWYCTCPGGAVTIGACAHIVSIVWYLSYARHHHFEPSKGRRRIQQAIMERIVVGEDDDMDDKDQEEEDDDWH